MWFRGCLNSNCVNSEWIYVSWIQTLNTKIFHKEIHAKYSHKLFDKVQSFFFKMILMNKWFSEFLTLKTKYFNDLIFWWFYWFSQNFSSKLFDKVQFFSFTLNTKYLQNNFRQSSRNAKFFKFDFLQRIDTKLNFVQVEISKNVDLKIIFNAMNHNGKRLYFSFADW